MRRSLAVLLFGALFAVQLLALDFSAKKFTDETGLKPASNKATISIAEGQSFQVTVVNLQRLAALGIPTKGLKAGTSAKVTYKGKDSWSVFLASVDVPFDWKSFSSR
jgi:hypothetical protein